MLTEGDAGLSEDDIKHKSYSNQSKNVNLQKLK